MYALGHGYLVILKSLQYVSVVSQVSDSGSLHALDIQLKKTMTVQSVTKMLSSWVTVTLSLTLCGFECQTCLSWDSEKLWWSSGAYCSGPRWPGFFFFLLLSTICNSREFHCIFVPCMGQHSGCDQLHVKCTGLTIKLIIWPLATLDFSNRLTTKSK